MKRLLLSSALAILTGCAAINAVTPGSAVTPSATVQVGIASGALAIDTVWNSVQQAYLTYAPTLPAATKAQLKTLMLSVYSCTGAPGAYVCTGYLQAAHDAQAVGNQSTLNAQVAQIETVIGEIKKLLPAGAIA